MNIEKVHRKNRKAISPVLATVILIAITLIAAIAIAGFVFGLFGSFTNSPQLTASNVTCHAIAGPLAECSMTLTNSGSGNAGIPSGTCSVNIGGAAIAGVMHTTSGGATVITSVAGNTAPIAAFCTTASAVVGQSGSTAVGNIQTSSATVPFSGTWS